MSKAPNYTIYRRTFADGREEYRVRVGWFLWLSSWLDFESGHCGVGRSIFPTAFSTRRAAELEIEADWERWLTTLPLVNHPPEQYDPLQGQRP